MHICKTVAAVAGLQIQLTTVGEDHAGLLQWQAPVLDMFHVSRAELMLSMDTSRS